MPNPVAPDFVSIRAVRLRHPWRWVIGVVLLFLVALVIIDAAQREAFDWPAVGKYMFDRRVSLAALTTVQLTIYSMVIGIVLGIILAVMRLSPNPILNSMSTVV